MKRQFSIFCLLFLAVVAVACESKQQGEDQASPPAEKSEQAEQAPADDQKADDQNGKNEQDKSSQLDIPDDQSMKGMSEGKNFYVVIAPEPNPIPFQDLFELEVEVFSSDASKKPADGVSLDQVRATMPAHGHGMKTEPKITKTGEGTFRVEGMKFHMQGEGEHGLWVIETVLSQGDTIDKATFDVQCCREQ